MVTLATDVITKCDSYFITWEIPKETRETIGETRGNVWGDGGSM